MTGAKEIVLVGAGGCMREIVWQMQEMNKKKINWKILGYVDTNMPEYGQRCMVGGLEIPYLGTDEYLLSKNEPTNVVICVGNPVVRKKIVTKLEANPKLHFPNVILGNTNVCEDVQMGNGCIISMDTRVSTNVNIGNFVFINIGSVICHDGKIGDFVTLSPDVKLAGNVTVGRKSEIGIGARVIQGISIGESVTIGAGAVVVKNIESGTTAVGVPAKKIRD